MPRRIIVTGAPGSGKTTTLDLVRDTDIEVVAEAASDVNLRMLDAGLVPHLQPDFLERIVALQRARRTAATAERQLHDRSVYCTLALARHLGAPVPVALWSELEASAAWFESAVMFFQPLGFLTPTRVRRIGYADAQRFGQLHREVYLEYGFTIVDVPAQRPDERAAVLTSAFSAHRSPAPAAVEPRAPERDRDGTTED